MRDNGNGGESPSGSGGHGQIKPVDWTRTEHQVAAHQGFRQGEVKPRGEVAPSAGESPTMRLAVPPSWTHRDDLPCVQRLPKGNEKDLYDTTDPLMAKALCAGCPVKRECLADAMAEEEGLGPRSRWLVRGGMTPVGRAKLAVQGVSNSPDGSSS